MSQVNYPFNPIMGPEKIVMKQEPHTGDIYFTTDTRKIYLNTSDSGIKIPMGGNIGLFYGDMKLTVPPVDGEKEFEFAITDIVGNETEENLLQPNINDLILNSDGCFYKVLSSTGSGINVVLNTEKLTIAGSGGGGGSDSSGDSLAGLSVSRLVFDYTSILYNKPCPVSFAVKLTDDLGDYVTNNVGTYILYVNGVEKESGAVKGISSGDVKDFSTINPEELTRIDVGPYLQLRNDNNIVISVRGSNGGSVTRGGNVAVTNMKLTWDYNETTVNEWITESLPKKESMKLSWKVSGVNLNKITYIVIDDDNQNKIKIGEGTKNEFEWDLKFAEYNLSHGAHSIKMWAETTIAGVTTPTDPIYKNIIIAKDNDSSTIISMGLFTKELTQYNTIKIPIFIYNPANTSGTAEIELFENGTSKDKWTNVQNLEVRDWAYTPTVSSNSMILTVQSGGREKSITVVVHPIDITINEKPGYAFKFKATDFSSNENIRNWGTESYGISFSEKFDWINGGLKTEEDGQGGHRQYVAVKAGSTMTIDYDMWAKNAPGYGKHLKVIFKAANCRDYDAHVLSSKVDRKIIYTDLSVEYYLLTEEVTTLTYSPDVGMDGYTVTLLNPVEAQLDIRDEESRALFQDSFVKFGNDVYRCNFIETEPGSKTYYAVWYKTIVQDSFWGLVLNAQNATLNSNNASVITQYCEDNYIEFEMEVTQQLSGKPYIKFWIDGVPCNYVRYSDSDRFLGDNKITIGSPECDVYIYLIKLYDDELSIDEHMDNFYADAPNAEEMVRRYRRNDIMDDNRDNEIDPLKLAVANPDCLVHIYDIPHIPTTKKDKTYPCKYEQYHGSKTAKLTADGVMIKVQGTSSEKYVVAAANLDTDFNYTDDGNVPSGIRDVASGNILEGGWSMDDGTAIPVDFFCTKVNVASCENANNALNQEWYNLFQPYQSVLRCKNPRARDTMQFTNGVLFMIDRNQKYDTSADADKKFNNVFGEIEGYIGDPYAKMYSLGQMGNSKDNVHVFHDITNPKECCIEVKDNQTPQQWMVSDDYNKADIGEKEKYFEFRYPDGASEASQDMIDGWNRLVSWFAHNNPSPKYDKHENITTEEQYKDFAVNKKTFAAIDVYVMNDEKTAYTKVEGFDPSISTYYTETAHIYGHTNLKLAEPKTFEAKELNGFIARNQKKDNGDLWQKDYQPVVQGCKISQYAGTYEYDTYEYRMAEMLEHCEEYLVMDSVLYHFLFIERHCMVDNVAKNTFWSTEDGEHWSLIKDYDNDTADGNDNNGKFTRTYGMEPMDRLNQNAYVFNAHQSVWFNFINGLKEACDWMYQKLESRKINYKGESISVWDSDAYLRIFDKWQRIIPERCWIEDYYRKYFRPSELYNDDMFVEMMEGGQKRYQRKQYETYEDIYMSSKYDGSTYLQSEIKFRPTGDNVKGLKLPLKVYSDCYVRMDLGSDTSKERVKRNTTVYVECPTNNLNNATMYLYPSKVFTSIGDINGGQVGHFAPDQGTFSGAPKLRELVFATADNPVYNTGLTGGLNFSANPLLEKLYIANLLKYENDLNLSECPSLLEVDASNSAFTGVTIADGAPTTKIILNTPTSLYLSNLSELHTLDIKSYNKLNTLTLNNIDNDNIKTKNIVETTLNRLAISGETLEYMLTKVKWDIDSASDIGSNSIILLDSLLNPAKALPAFKPDKKERYPYAAVLTGQLNVSAEAYSDSSTNALIMHDQYVNNEAFAELDLRFESTNSTLYDVIIYNGDGVEVWRRKAIPGTEITQEFLTNGPEGSFVSSSLEKSPTAEYVFEFLETWKVKNDNGDIIGTIENAEPIGPVVNSNIHLYPDFKQTSRYYLITLKAKHPTKKTVEILLEKEFAFGTTIDAILSELIEIPYADSSNLDLLHVYDFIGYSLVEDSTTLISSQFKVNGPATLWAVFNLVENARMVVHPEWFDIADYVLDDAQLDVHGSTGVILRPKYVLKGKVTIPSYVIHDGVEKPVIAIWYFGGGDQNSISPHSITHIFMEEATTQKPNKLYYIYEDCFVNSQQLKYFDFEKCALRWVGQRGFRSCPNLKYTGSLGNYLIGVSSYAFNQSLTADSAVALRIPSSVIEIGNYGFGILQLPAGSSLEIGTEEVESNLKLDAGFSNQFIMNQENKYTHVVFYSKLYEENDSLVLTKLANATNGDITIY